ncbi:Importin subunit beta-1 [Grifola frondosa]|uniref:Importin-95 n=1 Tax=Grifola frondosa TaxID=5627 RepID=A0A1C7MC49_GRIFR|nr:Importin subunit beta-1 [Grifola frondosa]
MNASELLANTLSPDTHTRQDATQKLESASRENYPAYLLMLSSELVNENSPPHIRNAAGLALKNALTAREIARQVEYSNRWLALDNDTRTKIKQDAFMGLGSAAGKVGTVAAQVIAAIAAVELPVGQWSELIEVLLGFVNQPANTNLRIATLQAIGFVCETIKPEILAVRSNEILTAVIYGARKEEPSPEVQLAAIHALLNSLEFVRDNFEREGERNYIMQVVCEATQCNSVPVQVGAFECLVRIMTLYYDKMGFYMERALFGLTVMGMKHSEQPIALQAIEFWSTVCEFESDLNYDAIEAREYGEVPDTENKHFAKVALPEITPVLLQLLTHQEEDADEDEWNVSMAAGTCLGFLAQAAQDPVVGAVVPFVEANLKSDDWHLRDAAVMAFGSILEGPDPRLLHPLVDQAFPILIAMMGDANVHVRDSVSWTLGRICDLLVTTIKPDVQLHPLISALRISWDSEGDDPASAATGPLSPYFDGVIQALLRVTESASNDENYRTTAYEAITSFVTHSSLDTITVVQNTALTVLSRMEQLLSMQNQIVGVDDRNNWNDLQTNFCGVTISVVRKLGAGIQPLADRIMTLMLQLIQAAGKTYTVMEDAFMVVGALSSVLESHFAPYIPPFLPYLYNALKAHEDTQLCTVAVGIIGDISRALNEQSAQYAGAFMGVLLENLQSDVLNRNVKISILSRTSHTMGVLRQAGALQPNPLDIDLVEYVAALREGIVEAYTGIVSGFKNTEKVTVLIPYVPDILELLQRCLTDSERTDASVKQAVGLIGDLADSFPDGQIKPYLLSEWIMGQLRTKTRYPVETKTTMRWAREMVKRATA